MKKLLSIIALLIILSAAAPTYAASPPREHGIAGFYIYIHINSDGSAYVEERITNRFIGQFNGVFRDINRRGGGDIADFRVWEYLPTTGEYLAFDQVRRAREGDSNVFTASRDGNIHSFQIFAPSRDEYRTFVYRYTITQGATRFLDAGQFDRYIVGSEWVVPIEAYQVTITFEGAPVQGHGELSATVSIGGTPFWHFTSATNDIIFESYGNQRLPGQTLSVNAIFPAEWLPDAPQTNRGINDRPFPWGLAILLGIAGIIVITIIVIYILARPHKVDFDERYYDKLPADNGPALMAYLVRHKNIKIKDVLASLLNMARDGILSVGKDDYGDYVFTRKFGTVRSLRPHEIFLINWLFDDIGDGTTLELAAIRQIGKSEDTAVMFHKKFSSWVEIVGVEAQTLEYFESSWRRTPHGELEYRKWLAFKRYLKNFTDVDKTDINAHDFWDNFLPYTLSLGSAEKLIKKLPDIPKPMEDGSLDVSDVLWFSLIGPQMLSACNTTFAATYNYAHSHAAATAGGDFGGSYTSSSGGGGGGAF